MSGVGASSGAVVRQGHLRKLKTMKKKYFVLRAETTDCSARLEYYESEKKFKAGASPRRVLALKSCYNIMRRLDLKQKHVIALFTREEQFCIVAENEQDLHGWLTAILIQHHTDDASEELLHPIQHVWQVNVQKKGLGSSKNIQGMYNLCLTDKTLFLVKIKSHNNVISDLGIPERIEYSLKNIRRCGDSECLFYMEVGRQTVTGAGELWMLSDYSNTAQSMRSTIYHAMRNCAKESEHERDHIVLPKSVNEPSNPLPARRQTYSDGRGRAGLSNDVETLRNRSVTMPSRGCTSFEAERTQSKYTEMEGLEHSRDDMDTVSEWCRTPRIPEEPDCCEITKDSARPSVRAGGSVQHSRTSSVGVDDSVAEGMLSDGYLPMAPGHDHFGFVHHSRTSSLVVSDSAAENLMPDGYLPMAPTHDHLGGLKSASSGSVCSGTPSTDPRFSEYQLEPATCYIGMECRPPRAYSVGSRPPTRTSQSAPAETRHRAYSAGARNRPAPAPHAARVAAQDHMELDFSNNLPSAKMLVSRTPPTTSYSMERQKPIVTDEYVDMSPRNNAGYVEMHPGPESLLAGASPASLPTSASAAAPDGYVLMNYGRAATRPIAIVGARAAPHPSPLPSSSSSPPGRRVARTPPHGSQTLFPMSLESTASPVSPPDEVDDLEEDAPHHTLSTVREISEDGRRSPPAEVSSSPQYVTLVRETHDEISCNPTANKTMARVADHESRGETSVAATVVLAGSGAPARFSLAEEPPSPTATTAAAAAPLNYAALDLEPTRTATAAQPRTYTQIDFTRSEKLHATDGT